MAHGTFNLEVFCARLGCLTSWFVPGVRRLAPALRCTGVQLRLQCSRPQVTGCNAASPMETPTIKGAIALAMQAPTGKGATAAAMQAPTECVGMVSPG